MVAANSKDEKKAWLEDLEDAIYLSKKRDYTFHSLSLKSISKFITFSIIKIKKLLIKIQVIKRN